MRISECKEQDDCPICFGEGWVCEDHPDTAWQDGDGCCGGAGAPCICNPLSDKLPLTKPLPKLKAVRLTAYFRVKSKSDKPHKN